MTPAAAPAIGSHADEAVLRVSTALAQSGLGADRDTLWALAYVVGREAAALSPATVGMCGAALLLSAEQRLAGDAGDDDHQRALEHAARRAVAIAKAMLQEAGS